MQGLISVIVPIYNSENKLERCIRSIINQSYDKLEIILVDDGSKDRSLQICKEFACQDGRIKVLTKPNGGVSSARNYGVSHSTGEWLTFVDSDDYIDEHMYEYMINKLLKNSADMIVCESRKVYKDKEVKEHHVFKEEEVVKGEEIYSKMLIPLLTPNHESASLLQSACNKIYSANIVKNNQCQFDEKLRYAEDWLFNIQYLTKADRVVFTKYNFYYYNKQVDNSLSSNWRMDCFEGELHIIQKLRQYVPSFYCNKDIKTDILWAQYGCLKNYVYFNGLKGFKQYLNTLFSNIDLKNAYFQVKEYPKRFYKAKKAFQHNNINGYFFWGILQVSDTAIKYYIKRILKIWTV